MMLAYRQWFRILVDSSDDWSLFAYTDASPQWRGRELFASSLDFIRFSGGSREMVRIQLPLVNIGSEYRTVAGKTFAFLWQLVLVVGPCYRSLRAVLQRIRSFTTDLGGEFMLRDVNDCLIGFLRSLSAVVPRSARVEAFLFPHCLAAVGWHHVMDGLMRFGLCQLRWFGGWLELTKAMCRWIRNSRDSIVTALIASGRGGAGALVGEAKIPSFAKWRWKTLAAVIVGLETCLPSLLMAATAGVFDVMVGCGQDRVLAGHIRTLLHCPNFCSRFQFVAWFCKWVTELESWGSSCPCPEHRGIKGVKCSRRGRLIHLAYLRASGTFSTALRELREWQPARFGNDLVFREEAEACVRATAARGLQKLRFLDRLPYILSQLQAGMPELAVRCLTQFAEATPDSHHRVTLQFLSADSLLRPHVVALSTSGEMHPDLHRQVEWLREIPIDDSIAESPHACARRQELHSRAGKFGWHASSQRLDQNLRDCQAIVPLLPQSLQWLWHAYRRVPNMRKPGQDLRIPLRALEKKIYHLQGEPPSGWDVNFAEEFVPEGGGGDEPSGGAKVVVAAGRRLAGHAAHFRDWLLQCVAPSMTVSCRSADGEFRVFQVLELPRRMITVKSYDHDVNCAALWSVRHLFAGLLHVFSFACVAFLFPV